MFFGLFKPQPEAASKTSDPRAVATGKQATLGPGFQSIRNATVLVTGSSGLVGARLVELCLERGVAKVVAVDLQAPDEALRARFAKAAAAASGRSGNANAKIILCSGTAEGDLTSDDAMEAAFAKAQQKIDICFHVGGLAGPFFDRRAYMDVNYRGTLRVIEKCQQHKVPKLVFSGSPSSRFTGADVTGQTEEELPMPTTWLVPYAESKALAEQAVMAANTNDGGLTTITVAPHQVYGPHDQLFMGNFLQVAGHDQLYIFGRGDSKVSVTYIDNYVHGLLCGADALSTPAAETVAGNFYIVTDDEPVLLWNFINLFVVGMGFVDLTTKIKLPAWLLYTAAYVANLIGFLTGRHMKLNPFNVKMLTMHRYFSIERAKRDLHYQPIVTQQEAVALTLDWYKTHWLPNFYRTSGKEPSVLKKLD